MHGQATIMINEEIFNLVILHSFYAKDTIILRPDQTKHKFPNTPLISTCQPVLFDSTFWYSPTSTLFPPELPSHGKIHFSHTKVLKTRARSKGRTPSLIPESYTALLTPLNQSTANQSASTKRQRVKTPHHTVSTSQIQPSPDFA
jgi:hypothetical protein